MTQHLIENWLPHLLSALTVLVFFMAGRPHPKTWLVGLFNQGLWLVWIISTENWGFLWMSLILTAVFFYNHLKLRART